MKLINIIQINTKKLRKHKSSAMFLVLPIALLVSLIIIISSQVTNIRAAATSSIFGTIEEQNTLLELTKDPSQFQTRGFGFNPEDLYYTENDVSKIEAIDNVVSTQMLVPVPVSNIVVTDLFDVNFSINRLVALGEEFAPLYTDQSFAYQEGTPIPIVLNANSFVEVYEDWGGKTEITMERGPMGRPNGENNEEDIRDTLPIKSRAIEYDKNDLLGKEITIRFGGLDEIQSYEIERTSSGMVMSKLTAEEVREKSDEKKNVISTYWNYDEIATPLEYKFIVVGIIEDESNTNTYVPQEFANTLMRRYIEHQLNARNGVAIPIDALGTGNTFTGLEYDGVELSSGGAVAFANFGGRPMGGFAIQGMASSGYNIPGLVIEVERESSSGESSEPWRRSSADVIGEYTDAGVYESSAKNGETILVKFASIYDRDQVIDSLNNLGYAYQDVSSTGVFEELKSTLNTVSAVSVTAFVGLSIVIIIFTMGKFISESRKEIGIFRAVGATKMDIQKLFITQASLYTLIGYVTGLIGGIALNLALAGVVKTGFDSFIAKTVKESFGVVNPVAAGMFSMTNWEAVAIYSAVLFAITILTSIAPAANASKLSPVEAIRGE